MEELISIVIALGLFGMACFLGWLIAEILNKCSDHKDKKRRQAHPELYRLFGLVDEKAGECCKWRNNQIYPKKKQVDRLIAEMPYLITEERIKAEQELEELRFAIHTATITDKVLESELEELRQQVRAYIEKHNLEWVRKWGW